MNELVFILAILVYQGILTKEEAYKLRKAHAEGVINADMKQMIAKVEKAFVDKEAGLTTVDAKDLLK